MDHGEKAIHTFLESIKEAVFGAQHIYRHLRTLEASLVDDLKPCEVRRRLPDHVVSIIVSCLPEDLFKVNHIQIRPKLGKAAQKWKLSDSHILFYVAYDYAAQGQPFFTSLRDFADAAPKDWHRSFQLLVAIPTYTSSTLLIASNPRSHTFGAKVNSDARAATASFPQFHAVSKLFSLTLFNIICQLFSIIPPAALPKAADTVLSDIVAPHTGNFTTGTTREEKEAHEFEKEFEEASEAFSAVDTQNMSERRREKRQRVDQPEIKPLAPADDLAALLAPGTGVTTDLLRKALSSFCSLSNPDVYLVDPTLILDMDGGSHEREQMIAYAVHFSQTTILPLEVEESCWVLVAVQRRKSSVTRVQLFDSSPTAKYHNRAKALTGTFFDHYLSTTPASRRELLPCAAPKYADEKDSGVYTFALVLHLMTQTPLPQQLTASLWRPILASCLGHQTTDWRSLLSAKQEESIAICRAFESAPPAGADLVARLEHAGQLIQAGKDWGTSTRARVEKIKWDAIRLRTEAFDAMEILDVMRDKAFKDADHVDDEMESHRQLSSIMPITKEPSMAKLERDFETAEQMSFRVETTTVGLGLVLEDAERLVADVQKGLRDVETKLHEIAAFSAGAL
ncbi:hypothetical protein K4K48_002343 [Colletotrichum sp. SAR 10_66]|nr:hypothetical protein K4K52_003487 [Colletotrichum sp. SAR 10_76]KAJ5000682.1 hypothetical protein K4K48_002343 [Colletotrichum sp. SAR 10_66]